MKFKIGSAVQSFFDDYNCIFHILHICACLTLISQLRVNSFFNVSKDYVFMNYNNLDLTFKLSDNK